MYKPGDIVLVWNTLTGGQKFVCRIESVDKKHKWYNYRILYIFKDSSYCSYVVGELVGFSVNSENYNASTKINNTNKTLKILNTLFRDI